MAKHTFELIFFQHFIGLSVKDLLLRKPTSDYFCTGVQCAYESDIVKNMTDFGQLLADRPVFEYKVELNLFMSAISSFEFCDLDDGYRVFFQARSKQNKHFEAYNFLEYGPNTRKAKIHIGELLKEEYACAKLYVEEIKALAVVVLYKNQYSEEMAAENTSSKD